MGYEEISAHDYLMDGISAYYPEEYKRCCKLIDDELVNFVDGGHIDDKNFLKFDNFIFTLDDIFGKKNFFKIIPGLLHVRE